MERAGNLLLAEVRTVVTLDQQRDSTAFIDMTRPCQRAVERVEFLVQQSILFQRSDRLRSSRTAVDSVCHRCRRPVATL